MSTYYMFMAEACYDGKWYNIDYFTRDFDGKMSHQYLAVISRGYIGRLADIYCSRGTLSFEELAQSTQELLLNDHDEAYQDYVRLDYYYNTGSLDNLKELVEAPYEREGYITRNQAKALKCGELDDIPYDEILTAKEVLALPEDARSEYTLCSWDYTSLSRQTIKRMVAKIEDQLAAFNESLLMRSDLPSTEHYASGVRIICRMA